MGIPSTRNQQFPNARRILQQQRQATVHHPIAAAAATASSHRPPSAGRDRPRDSPPMAPRSARKSGASADLSAQKKKKKSTKRLLSAPEAVARKSAKPLQENPFDSTWTSSKQDVLGKKRKGEGRSVGLARSRAMEKRRKSLLKDYKQSRKSSRFIDNRIGENDDELREFDKGILRLQRERQLKLKKEKRYNLSDGEEDDYFGLHQAELLSDVDDFQDEVPLDEDDETDQTQKNFTAIRHLTLRSMRDQLEPSLQEGEENKQKTKKQVMEEIIAKSKFYKAQKAMAKEEDAHLMEQLDKNFTSLNQSNVFLPLRQPTDVNALKPLPGKSHANSSVEKGVSSSAGKASIEERFGDFDKLVRELPMEKRARATDRTKSAEEIAEEERERLQLLEEERQRRMHATYDSDDEENEDDVFHKLSPKKSRHISGNDLGDSLCAIEKLVDKTGRFDDKVSNFEGAYNRSSEDSQDDDDDDGDDDDSNDETSDGDEGNGDDKLHDDVQNVPCTKNWEQSEDDFSTDGDEGTRNAEIENVKNLGKEHAQIQENKYSSTGKKEAYGKSPSIKKDSLPFVIEAPKGLSELCLLIDNRPEEEVVVAIHRIRVCNPLTTENRRKLQVFYGVLLQYFAIVAARKPCNIKLINLLVKPLVEMSFGTPYFAAICARERLLHIRNQFCEDVKNSEKSSWPSLKSLILLRLWFLTFPCSDFRHVVLTPATLLMCEYLMRCPILTGRDAAIGSLLCTMLLSVAKKSLKFYPEVIIFLQFLLLSATRTPGSQHLCQFRFMDPKTLKPWLYLHNQVTDIHPIDFFSIMSMPAESPFFGSDNFRASVLVTVVETLHGFVNICERFSSFPEIFLPISSLLHEVIQQDTTPDVLQGKMVAVVDLIKRKADELQMLRQPLKMQKEKPPIKLLNPKFEENFFKGMDYDPDRERVERKKLKKLLRKEAKGASRELRKDNYFLHGVKEKERLLHEEERAEMYGKARAFLQEQEHAFKSGQLGKGRKRRR